MSLFVVAEFLAVPGRHDRLRTALEALIEPTLDEPGCLAYRIYTDPNDPARMVAVERWEDRQALDAHLATPHLRHARRVLDRILARPLTLRTLVEVGRESAP
ncbi:antibiotic biosynthesis monooxygenase [Streptomyces sp. RS10V-4]|uniref:putative quinol monooxygenase n=1 Tax=Streptomyces rhizoryzae TaxID=2932493 RepID=UPI002003B30E|nr:putative quinol monooxygenase [Streptomyces rhizoryzae]MCK7621787.1 antibiotic biosynthesis monooxygenase [Streptomyces rhizoryzae]